MLDSIQSMITVEKSMFVLLNFRYICE